MNGYIDHFDDSIKKQFTEAGINEPENVLTIDQIEDLDLFMSPKDKDSFVKILKFDCRNTEDSAEFAFAWILNAKHVGKSQVKSDIILPNGDGVSIKSGEGLIKFGRIGSSNSYKELMNLWSFYVGFLGGKEQGLQPTRISKKQVGSLDLSTASAISKFLDVSLRSIPIFYDKEDSLNIKEFVLRMISCCGSINNRVIDLINQSIKESLDKIIKYIIVVDKNNLKVRLIKNIDSDDYINNFFHSNFNHIAGNEVFIEVK